MTIFPNFGQAGRQRRCKIPFFELRAKSSRFSSSFFLLTFGSHHKNVHYRRFGSPEALTRWKAFLRLPPFSFNNIGSRNGQLEPNFPLQSRPSCRKWWVEFLPYFDLLHASMWIRKVTQVGSWLQLFEWPSRRVLDPGRSSTGFCLFLMPQVRCLESSHFSSSPRRFDVTDQHAAAVTMGINYQL